ncbi:MAG: hypothetical protein HY326_03560 [Chloroflexi bacterium]|nr:hypothetical protein [Chloroflexota bacterium]
MSVEEFDILEQQLMAAGKEFPFPATPDITGRLRRNEFGALPYSQRRLRWTPAVVAILLLIIVMAAVPPVRAAVVEVLRIGAIRIFTVEPPPPPTATPAPATDSVGRTSVPITSPTTVAMPAPTFTPLKSLPGLAGKTTLAEVQARYYFLKMLPAYPPNLGQPDGVFLQDLGGPALILVWLEPGSQEKVKMSLQILSKDIFGAKSPPRVISQTMVNGQPAAWTEGPHFLQFYDAQGRTILESRRLVQGNVLIWMEGSYTYRLETDLPLNEAVKIAESLQ